MENGYIGTTLSVCDEVVAMYKKNKGKNPWTYFFRDDGLSLEKRYENWAPLRSLLTVVWPVFGWVFLKKRATV